MVFAIWIAAWLVFIVKLAIIAIASMICLAVLLALTGAAAKVLRMHSAQDPTAPKDKARILRGEDAKKECVQGSRQT